MIGFYDYTVVVTYISLVSSILGMFCAIDGKLTLAVSCLAFSGLCDMFDGKIARTKKNRTDDEKSFGIQIDSLCDIVCFGIFPIILGYKLGMCKAYSIAILAFYGMAGVIRLAYFNVMEAKRQSETSENRKYYQGLPITSMAVIMPFLNSHFVMLERNLLYTGVTRAKKYLFLEGQRNAIYKAVKTISMLSRNSNLRSKLQGDFGQISFFGENMGLY